MAQKRKKAKEGPVDRQKVFAVTLVSVLALAIIGALVLSAPGVGDAIFKTLGLHHTMVVPQPVEGEFGPVSVHFIEVGQGDAVLVEADGEFALIDAGPPEGQENLMAYLEAAGVPSLRYLIMTHPHADHIGGMQAVVEKIPVSLAVLPDFAKGPLSANPLFESLIQTMIEYSVPSETAVEGAAYPLGSGTITILQAGIATDENLNFLSLMTLFEAEDFRFLSTGDAETQNEKDLVASGRDVTAHLYKAGHHGSNTSSSRDFVFAMRPSLVVVSSGENNKYGHPHRDPLNNFEQAGAMVLNTAQTGTVRAGPDGAGGIAFATAQGQEADLVPQAA